MQKQISETIIIRPIEERDNPAIAALIRKIFEEFDAPKTGSVYSDSRTDNLYQCFNRPDAKYWIVECNDEILGGCGFFPTEGLAPGCAELVKFYLSPLLRGKGIGSYLLNTVETEAKKRGYKQLYIESFPHFHNAVSLYERKGFVHLDSRIGNSGHSATTIHMLKDI